MAKNKQVQHYNDILKDKKRRERHFSRGGALGDEKEGREPGRVKEVERHNEEAREKLGLGMKLKKENEMLEKLKKGEKVEIGR